MGFLMPLSQPMLLLFICAMSQAQCNLWHPKQRWPQVTIPQLELLPCLLLARLMAHVEEALKPVVKVQLGLCFTDFKVVLYWVQGGYKDWSVNNRVTEIRHLVPAINWSHCPGKDNPVDLPSRGISPRELQSNQAWIHGPQWLPKISLKQQIKVTDMLEE